MNAEEFFNYRKSCLICGFELKHFTIINNNDGYSEYYDVSNVEFKLKNKNHIPNLFTLNLSLKDSAGIKEYYPNSNMRLGSRCGLDDCNNYSYGSYLTTENKLNFVVYKERLVIPGVVVLEFKEKEDKLIMYFGDSKPIQTITLRYKPIEEFIRGRDFSALEDKINKFKVLL